MKKDKEIQNLINQGFGYMGMINEAKLKCLLLKKRIEKILNQKPQNSKCTYNAIKSEVLEIQKDIHKYTHKLKIVENKLREHGIFTEVE